MKRRDFLAGTFAAGVGATAWKASASSTSGPKAGTPNLLIIHTDQQSAWTVSAYGGTLLSTPNIDSLASEGAILKNFFTNSAVCTPSRGAFFTGRYPHAHGAYKNNIELNRDEITIAHVLQQNGYDTGYAGKWHLDGTPKPGWMTPDRSMGFEYCKFMFNRGHYKQIREQPDGDPLLDGMGDENTYTTDWLADKTVEFIDMPRTKPFFFTVCIPDPHTPFTVRSPYDTMYAPSNMTVPSTAHQSDLPNWANNSKFMGQGNTQAEREQWLQVQKARYCGEVKCIDDNVGKILDALRNSGQLDNTVVVFTTDHGEYMGEHGLMHKNQLYETAYRLPFLIRWPEKISAGTVVENIISTVDFQPTVLALMGIAPSGREQGKDASGLLQGQNVNWKDESFIHHSSLERAGIFTPEFELAYVKDRDAILFDRINDPEQVNNLFDNPAYSGVVVELTRRIVKHNVAVDAPATSWLKKLASVPLKGMPLFKTPTFLDNQKQL